jgi:hypothetical protein
MGWNRPDVYGVRRCCARLQLGLSFHFVLPCDCARETDLGFDRGQIKVPQVEEYAPERLRRTWGVSRLGAGAPGPWEYPVGLTLRFHEACRILGLNPIRIRRNPVYHGVEQRKRCHGSR